MGALLLAALPLAGAVRPVDAGSTTYNGLTGHFAGVTYLFTGYLPAGSSYAASVIGALDTGSAPLLVGWGCDIGSGLRYTGYVAFSTRPFMFSGATTARAYVGPWDYPAECTIVASRDGSAGYSVATDQVVYTPPPPGYQPIYPSAPPSISPYPTDNWTPGPVPTPTPAPTYCLQSLAPGQYGPPAPVDCATPAPSPTNPPNGVCGSIGWSVEWGGCQYISRTWPWGGATGCYGEGNQQMACLPYALNVRAGRSYAVKVWAAGAHVGGAGEHFYGCALALYGTNWGPNNGAWGGTAGGGGGYGSFMSSTYPGSDCDPSSGSGTWNPSTGGGNTWSSWWTAQTTVIGARIAGQTWGVTPNNGDSPSVTVAVYVTVQAGPGDTPPPCGSFGQATCPPATAPPSPGPTCGAGQLCGYDSNGNLVPLSSAPPGGTGGVQNPGIDPNQGTGPNSQICASTGRPVGPVSGQCKGVMLNYMSLRKCQFDGSPVGILGFVACLIAFGIDAATNGVTWAGNVVIDLFEPSQAPADHWAEVQARLGSKVPFSLVAAITSAGTDASAGSSAVGIGDVTLAGATVHLGTELDSVLDTANAYRIFFVGGILYILVLKIWARIEGALGLAGTLGL